MAVRFCEIKADGVAVVKFLQKTTGRFEKIFKWPATVEIAEVNARFVFAWDFDVDIESSDGRVWSVPSVNDLCKQYDRHWNDINVNLHSSALTHV